MKYYISSTNELYAYAADGSQDAYILEGLVPATDAQVQAIQNPPLTQAQIIASFEIAVQVYLDAQAAAWNYESVLSAASYANSTVTQFKNEALALIAWRDAVWSACYAAEAGIIAGTQPMPASAQAFIATLPAAPARPV